jgi:hypothetical protein
MLVSVTGLADIAALCAASDGAPSAIVFTPGQIRHVTVYYWETMEFWLKERWRLYDQAAKSGSEPRSMFNYVMLQ